jgi:hypothetical protein
MEFNIQIQMAVPATGQLIKANAVKVEGEEFSPAVIRAQDGARYSLVDMATQLGPKEALITRSGDDLLISVDSDDETAEIIIEDFYLHPNEGIIGEAPNGEYYQSVPARNQRHF